MNKIFLTLIFFICAFSLRAQKSNTSYDFPIKPGTEEWKSFKSVEDMYKACQIPPDTLRNLSTKALIQSCLNYPASAVLMIHNTPQQGFEDWKQHFNGITELLNRNNAAEELLKIYSEFDTKGHDTLKTDIEKGNYTFKLAMLENIIVQDEISSSLTVSQQKNLLKNCLEKYQNMEVDKVYGFTSIISTGRIISKISMELGDEALKSKVQTSDVQEFIKTGFLKDRQNLLDIIAEASQINTNE